MKRNSLLLSLSTVVWVCLAGCAGGGEDADSQPSAEQPAGEQQPEIGTPEEQARDGEIQAQGKTCTVACTVQNYGSGTCPATVVGTHSTTFLGGCNKACSKAREQAASRALPPGCVIYMCDSGNGC